MVWRKYFKPRVRRISVLFYFRIFEAFKSKKENCFFFCFTDWFIILFFFCYCSTLVNTGVQKTLERLKSVWLPLHTCHCTALLKVLIFLPFCLYDSLSRETLAKFCFLTFFIARNAYFVHICRLCHKVFFPVLSLHMVHCSYFERLVYEQ